MNNKRPSSHPQLRKLQTRVLEAPVIGTRSKDKTAQHHAYLFAENKEYYLCHLLKVEFPKNI